jgi:glucose/arabinose dehydrogenase
MASRSWLASAGALFVLFVTLSHAQAPPGQRGRGAGQGRGAAAAPAAPPITEQVLSAGNVRYRVVPVASGLFHPWSLGFLPDGGLLVAERNGQLRLIRNGVLLPTPLWKSTAEKSPLESLHSVAVHPQFAQNHFIYLSYPKQGDRGTTMAISRGRLEGDKLVDVKDIFVADAWDTGGNLAGRMLLGPDNSLYLTVGDQDRICCNAQQLRPDGTDDNTLRMRAQELNADYGKTLRLRDDGTVPPDNPFVNRPDAKPEIFTYGHRNGYGLAFNPETRDLWQAEIGPMGGDEVNILIAGHNYGWPLVSMGRNYTGTLVSDQPWFRPGMDNPRIFWVPSISPSSIMFYTGDKFPAWKNSLFIGALTTKQLLRMAFKQPSQAEKREPLLAPLNVRIRDVVQGPDGNIYVATEQSVNGQRAEDYVLRLEPAS